MDINSIYANAGYSNNVTKYSKAQKTTNTAGTEKTAEFSDAEKLENFKKEIWNEIDRMPRSSGINWSFQISDGAFERMMKEPEFKDKMMSVMREDASVGRYPITSCMTIIDENGYSGYSYNFGYGKEAFAAHSKDKDSFYAKKATKKQDYNKLYEKERQQKKLQQEKLDDEYWDNVDMKRIMFKRQQASKAYDG